MSRENEDRSATAGAVAGAQVRQPLAPDDPRHGTENGYGNLGCRCDACRVATVDYARAWRHRTGRNRPLAQYLAEIAPKHGTESGYTNLGCRCDACRAASASARRQRRAAHPNTKVHGRSGYSNGCRCAVCHAAEITYQREYRRAKRNQEATSATSCRPQTAATPPLPPSDYAETSYRLPEGGQDE